MSPQSDKAHKCVWDSQAWNEEQVREAIENGKISWGTIPCFAHENQADCPQNAATTPSASTQHDAEHQKHKHGQKEGSSEKGQLVAHPDGTAKTPGLPAQPVLSSRFANGININGTIIKPNDPESFQNAYQKLYEEFAALSFCPDRHDGLVSTCTGCSERLVYSQELGPDSPQVPIEELEFYVDDHRPTIKSDNILTHHCSIQDCKVCIIYYLGCRHRSEVAAIAMSGPVLKHLPAFYALLWPSDEGRFPDLEETCTIAAQALSLLMKHETRLMLPNSLPEIEKQLKLSLAAAGPKGAAAISSALGETRKRAEVVASLILSLYGDLMKACKTPAKEYDATYSKYARALEKKNNPWRSPLFHINHTPGAKFRMPFWGPHPSVCRCGHVDCMSAEHDVEVYHRTLTLVRWTLNQMVDPAVFFHRKNGIGNARRLEYESNYVLSSISGIMEEQKQERDRPAKHKMLEGQRRMHLEEGATRIFKDLQGSFRLQNIYAAARTAGLFMILPALLVNTPATKIDFPFPKNGNVEQKEAWVKQQEERIWAGFSAGGMTRITHPQLGPEIRWYARYRAQWDHDYVAIRTAEDIADDDSRRPREHTAKQKEVIETNDLKVQIALTKLKVQGPKLDMDQPSHGDNKGAFLAWVDSQGDAVMDIFRLAGASEEDRGFLLAITSQFVCYHWVARRNERGLQCGPDMPGTDDIKAWGKNLTVMAGCRAELSFFFRDSLSEAMLKKFLDAVVKACYPGEKWLRACDPHDGPRARRHQPSFMQMGRGQ
ncbi:hypothetical protein B0T11DRAFT_330192 [Plectosphaerella cucumerina]|uniref:Uncharacterized protein n=1 Tax=Plectosphaerella cucumerina TaxID=40658 RepID=A0A8K0X176_9PEZI|nr:hypothetical protein B0T11DRAFT_330192 [Plectosphaerella cucumerina]